MRPSSVQTASSNAGEPTDLAMPAGVRKMPTPITCVTIIAVAVDSVSRRDGADGIRR
jgi:hypothetical protein